MDENAVLLSIAKRPLLILPTPFLLPLFRVLLPLLLFLLVLRFLLDLQYSTVVMDLLHRLRILTTWCEKKNKLPTHLPP